MNIQIMNKYGRGSKMYINNQLNHHLKKKNNKSNRGLVGESYWPKGDHLDGVNSDQKVLKVIRRGRLVLVIRDQEPQS
jgi:hypothetical protein